MNDRRVSSSLHDSGNRVWNVKHEACSELTIRLAGVYEARRVRHELARIHNVAHRVIEKIALRRISLGDRNVRDYARYDVAPFFNWFGFGVFQRVTFRDDLARIQTQRVDGSPHGNLGLE